MADFQALKKLQQQQTQNQGQGIPFSLQKSEDCKTLQGTEIKDFAAEAYNNLNSVAMKLIQQSNSINRKSLRDRLISLSVESSLVKDQPNMKLGPGGSGLGGHKEPKGFASLKKNQKASSLNREDSCPDELDGRDPKDIKTNDWYQWYQELSKKLANQKETNKTLHEDIMKRQNRYQAREQSFRKEIDELQRELRVRLGYEKDARVKNEKIVQIFQKELHKNIAQIEPKTIKLQEDQSKDIIRKFNSELNKMKKRIEERKSQKGDQAAELKDRENELNHHLELITNIAQRIDNENRALMKKNQELIAEYKQQENDRELLVKQLVMQKKENKKLKDEIEANEKILQKAKYEDDQEVDGFDDQSQMNRNPSKLMESRLNNNFDEKRTLLMSRGTTNQTAHKNSQPLLYVPTKKQETEEEKVLRYERVIDKLKKMMEHERKQLKTQRGLYQREMAQKTELEHYLKETVDKVKAERKKQSQKQRNKQISKNITSAAAILGMNSGSEQENYSELTQQERERVIELLLSQEKVINLLYDRTFPMTSMDGMGPNQHNFKQSNYMEAQQEQQDMDFQEHDQEAQHSQQYMQQNQDIGYNHEQMQHSSDGAHHQQQDEAMQQNVEQQELEQQMNDHSQE